MSLGMLVELGMTWFCEVALRGFNPSSILVRSTSSPAREKMLSSVKTILYRADGLDR